MWSNPLSSSRRKVWVVELVCRSNSCNGISFRARTAARISAWRLLNFGSGSWRGQGAHEKLFAPAFLLPAHRLRQNRLERDFRRTTIIIGHPPRQFQDLRRDVRLPPDGLDDRPKTGMRRRFDKRRHAAQHLAIGKRHFDASADFDNALQFRRG